MRCPNCDKPVSYGSEHARDNGDPHSVTWACFDGRPEGEIAVSRKPREIAIPEFVINVLGAQLKASRKANELLHRRAQRLEGVEEHMAKVHAGYQREVKNVRRNAARKIVLWKGRYRDAVKQIVASGTSDAHELTVNYPNIREGRLNVMVERLIAERNEARKERDELRRLAGGGCCGFGD